MSKSAPKRKLPPHKENKDDSLLDKFKSNAPIISIVAVIVAVVLYYQFKVQGPSIDNLLNANENKLKDVLTGDKPFLHYCQIKSDDTQYSTLFKDISSRLGSFLGFSILNCDHVLPSGKSIYDRFKLRKDINPIIFGTAPWSKPKQVTRVYMEDSKSMSMFVDKFLGPHAQEVATDHEMNAICGLNKPDETDMSSIKNTCLVLIRGTRHNKALIDLEEKLIRQWSRAKVVIFDGKRKRLSFEDLDDSPSDSFGLKVYAIRSGGYYLPMTNSLTWDYLNTFISYAFAQPLSSYTKHKDNAKNIRLMKVGDIIKRKKAAEEKAKKAKKTSSSSSGKKKPVFTKSSGAKGKSVKEETTTTSTSNKTPEELEKERIARERARREEMDRMSAEYLAAEEEGDSSSSSGSFESEESEDIEDDEEADNDDNSNDNEDIIEL